jgi:hypothetical protein
MLGWFPELYPDELLASACARYTDRLEYPTQHTAVRELFGAGCSRVAYDVPGHLNHLVGQLAERVAQLERQIGEAPSTVIYKAVGMIQYRKRCVELLRFCLKCALEDEVLYGEPYWHRNHQLPGVLVCTKHGEFLRPTKVTMHGACLMRAKYEIQRSPIPAGNDSKPDRILVELANDARRILEDNIHLSLFLLRQQYRVQLEAMRVLRKGRLLTEKAADGFINRLSPSVLQRLSFDSHSKGVGPWIKQIAAGHIYHPLDHLVMMRYLQIPVP